MTTVVAMMTVAMMTVAMMTIAMMLTIYRRCVEDDYDDVGDDDDDNII